MANEEVVMTRRVLIGMDGSLNANDAFDFYMKDLHRSNDYVIVGYCPDHGFHFSLDSILPHHADQVSDKMHAINEKCEQVKRILEEKIAEANVHGCVQVLGSSNPGHALVKAAETNDAAMIIIGSRGHGTLRRTVLGSVSDYILHHSQVPVFVQPHIHHHGHHQDKKHEHDKDTKHK